MTDRELRAEVLAEVECEPGIYPEQIGVAAVDGVVSLFGQVESYTEKLAIERAVRRVYSARAVIDHVEVSLPSRDEVTDSELAIAAVRAVEALTSVPPDSARLIVQHGHVTLEGVVDTGAEHESIAQAVQHLRGLRGVTNRIRVRAEAGVTA
jgi:osmotically-inducible protein OsmY